MSWRKYTDWAKRRPEMLRLAAYLGRGRGRFRVLDRLNPPPLAPHKPDLSNWENEDLAACWIGHATVLLRVGGMTVLTDPVMFNKVGVGLGLITGGPRRFIAPALRLRELPKLDLILVSHAHFDHLDRPTLQRLDKCVPVITSHHTHDLIRDLGFKQVTELQWGEHLRVGEMDISAREVRHWGARTFYDSHRGFNAYLIEGAGKRVLYGGDTAYHQAFKDIGKVDLAIFGIGAYNPWEASHATPEQAWEMADHVSADHILPMHHSTFKLSHEPMNEPIERLMEVAGRLVDRIVAHEIGMTWTA
ncbi:MAG: MBL fold metallo-hydrolase [Anaerolineae bacterium]|nr:MBL fold metallo-hydrolase [Phycisphaerae bacterium]